MGIRFALLLVLCAAVTIAATSCGGSSSSEPTSGSASSSADAIVVSLLDTMTFEPSTITVAPGDTVTLRLVNKGALAHNFSIKGLDVNVDVSGGDTKTTTFTAPASPGEYKIFCDMMGHEGAGMVGAFVVQQ